ncbi:MAG: hypothetical protein RL357_1221 [Pseudomonadota bacterium]
MLRVLIALLLIANACVWVWRENGFARWGWPAHPEMSAAGVPESSLNAERIVPIEDPATTDSLLSSGIEQTVALPTGSADWTCWRLGPFAKDRQIQLQSALPLNHDELNWEIKDITLPQRWAVVTPKSNADDVAAWKEQAKAQNIDHRTSDADTLKGRLILATFVSRDLANKATEQLIKKGWAGLTIIRERPPIPALALEVQSPDETSLDGVKSRIAAVPVLGGQALQVSSCPQNAAPKVQAISSDSPAGASAPNGSQGATESPAPRASPVSD